MGTAVMLVLIWFPATVEWPVDQATAITTPALYFESMAACEDAMPAVREQVIALNPLARVSARCYEEAEDPRG